jgi:hypothetical protein
VVQMLNADCCTSCNMVHKQLLIFRCISVVSVAADTNCVFKGSVYISLIILAFSLCLMRLIKITSRHGINNSHFIS